MKTKSLFCPVLSVFVIGFLLHGITTGADAPSLGPRNTARKNKVNDTEGRTIREKVDWDEVLRFAELAGDLRKGIRLKVSELLIEPSDSAPLQPEFTFINDTNHQAVVECSVTKNPTVIFKPKEFKAVVPARGQTTVRCEWLVRRSKPRPHDAAQPPIKLKWTSRFTPPGAKEFTFKHSREIRVTEVLPCAPAPSRVKVDGILNDWPGRALSVLTPAEITRQSNAHKGPKDCSFTIQTLHDRSFLYVAVRVMDDELKFNTKQPVWKQDGVEVRLDARPFEQREGSTDWKDLLPILVSPAARGGEQVIWNAEKLPEGTQVASARSAGGYSVEIAIPLSYLENIAGADWRRFRLNVTVDDFDGSDQGPQLWWWPDWRNQEQTGSEGTFQRQASPQPGATNQI